ncbi:DUF2971 domain-containing protein [Pseudomonas sp. NKUCC02_KPG]|uniref:DUF2971 domain-containing protein n=1 Tax=Pseudomonas sp. NKUCC02_KPG TaxID=2842124 RepID=UPI001C5A6780|nr:DUF2971 domain-containing protein [Pseudomonas sp. NKUCC02_KPG]MBW3503334.1 DUF2971 domain-containing protein [Pseudomonas sp. NKUCC02_KPG]
MSEVKKVRVYHFLNAKYGIEGLQQRRLKVARLLELNDPFEFCCFDFSEKGFRDDMSGFKKIMAAGMGFICCSRSYSSPVQWAHYANKHKGICLGFDVDEDLCLPVNYVSERMDVNSPSNLIASEQEIFMTMISTKFDHWRYEDEVRFPVHFHQDIPLAEKVFYSIGSVLQLRQVIVGCDLNIKMSEVLDAAKGYGGEVEVLKVRPDFRTYKMVVDSSEGCCE